MNQIKIIQCPECKSVQIEKTADEKLVFDGGKVIGTISAQYKCNACNYEFGEGEDQDAKEEEIVVETSCPVVGEIRVSSVYKIDVIGELIKFYPTVSYDSRFKWHTTKFGEKFLDLYITDRSTGERVDHWKFVFVKINGVIKSV